MSTHEQAGRVMKLFAAKIVPNQASLHKNYFTIVKSWFVIMHSIKTNIFILKGDNLNTYKFFLWLCDSFVVKGSQEYCRRKLNEAVNQ